jgi:hypothetical protein
MELEPVAVPLQTLCLTAWGTEQSPSNKAHGSDCGWRAQALLCSVRTDMCTLLTSCLGHCRFLD